MLRTIKRSFAGRKRQRGRILAISGPSGAGKGTFVKALLKQFPGRFSLSVSATTRKMRSGEVNGVEYHFLDKQDFEKVIQKANHSQKRGKFQILSSPSNPQY